MQDNIHPVRDSSVNVQCSTKDMRVLVVPPTARDGEITLSLLSHAGLSGTILSNLRDVCEEMQSGVGALLITAECLKSDSIRDLIMWVQQQASWSDLPIILLMKGGHQTLLPHNLLQALGNVTLLENPAPTRSVVSALQTAVRARLRQYQIRDHITASQKAEINARELKERLAIALEASELGTFHCPLPFSKIEWNQQCKSHFGLPPDAEVDAEKFFSLIHPADLEGTRQAIEACIFDHQPYDVQYRVLLPDKTNRWIRATGKTYYDADDQPLRFDGTTQDVTKQKQAEVELATHAERQRLLWEAAAVLLTAADPDTMMSQLFTKVSQHFGVDSYFNFMVDQTGESLQLVSSVGVPQELLIQKGKVAFGEAVCGNVALKRKAIVAHHIQSSDDPMVDLIKGFGIRAYACNPLISDERLIGTLSFASRTRDSFDESELSFFETIAHYVTTAYVKLQLVDQLKEADQRKDEFLATLAHELRNPLAPISSGFQVIRLAGDNRQVVDRVLDTMERQLAQMVRLIDDLLDLSRITRNKLELREERVELARVIQDAIETSRPQIDQAKHELIVELPSETVTLEADPIRLSQVFANLLNNAAKYTLNGGQIRLNVECDDAEAVVTVRDTGIGIAQEHLPKLFKMFSQVTPALERSQGGLGIGLALVRGLVQMHGGSVEAASDGVGKGSEFVVRLPLVGALRLADHLNKSMLKNQRPTNAVCSSWMIIRTPH
jgi:PAS domain S-box-containing protein